MSNNKIIWIIKIRKKRKIKITRRKINNNIINIIIII